MTTNNCWRMIESGELQGACQSSRLVWSSRYHHRCLVQATPTTSHGDAKNSTNNVSSFFLFMMKSISLEIVVDCHSRLHWTYIRIIKAVKVTCLALTIEWPNATNLLSTGRLLVRRRDRVTSLWVSDRKPGFESQIDTLHIQQQPLESRLSSMVSQHKKIRHDDDGGAPRNSIGLMTWKKKRCNFVKKRHAYGGGQKGKKRLTTKQNITIKKWNEPRFRRHRHQSSYHPLNIMGFLWAIIFLFCFQSFSSNYSSWPPPPMGATNGIGWNARQSLNKHTALSVSANDPMIW